MGLIGAGSIAARYVEGLRATPGFAPVAVCARTPQGAMAFADAHGLRAMGVGAMLADAAIDYVLNLTPAHAHAALTRRCLEAGKPVYSEKPLAATLEEADALIAMAEAAGLLLACAPTTFLWPAISTARRLVAEGALGPLVGALTTLVHPGPELFHPNPRHLYGAAAGPLLDMGVYQVTTLLALLGPVRAVSAMAGAALAERTVRVGPEAGARFPVHAPTHVQAMLRHANGAISGLVVSFDGVSASAPRLDIWGRNGGLALTGGEGSEPKLALRLGSEAKPVALDTPGWSAAMWSLGPTAAWTAHAAKAPVETSARRARDALAVLLGIQAAMRGGMADIDPGPHWR